MSACRSCNAPVRWVVVQASGRRMPLDPDPVADGNVVVLEDDLARVLKGPELAARHALPGGPGPLHKSHFATCPDADRHRT